MHVITDKRIFCNKNIFKTNPIILSDTCVNCQSSWTESNHCWQITLFIFRFPYYLDHKWKMRTWNTNSKNCVLYLGLHILLWNEACMLNELIGSMMVSVKRRNNFKQIPIDEKVQIFCIFILFVTCLISYYIWIEQICARNFSATTMHFVLVFTTILYDGSYC